MHPMSFLKQLMVDCFGRGGTMAPHVAHRAADYPLELATDNIIPDASVTRIHTASNSTVSMPIVIQMPEPTPWVQKASPAGMVLCWLCCVYAYCCHMGN